MTCGNARFLRGVRLLVIAAGLLWGFGGPGSTRCLAHPGNIASAVAKVQPDGRFEVRLRFDVLAYVLGGLPNHVSDTDMNALLDGPPSDLDSRLSVAKDQFRQRFRAGSGGTGTIETIAFPNAAEVLQSVKGRRTRLPVLLSVTVAGHLPPGAKLAAFAFDEGLGAIVLTTEFPYQEPISEPVDAGATSEGQPIPTAEATARSAATLTAPLAVASKPQPSPIPTAAGTPAALTKVPKPKAPAAKPTPPVPSPVATGSPAPSPSSAAASASPSPSPSPSPQRIPMSIKIIDPDSPEAAQRGAVLRARQIKAQAVQAVHAVPPAQETPKPAPRSSSARWLTHFGQYIKMGYTHILPEGIDHILFILGLFLLSTKIKPLLQQVTAFTVAHSLTLALSLYGIVRLPASIVEPVIAISIAYIAVENLFSSEIKAGRIALVFGFGLIHGLGFAAALTELGLKQTDLLSALLGFNVGVELGQLSVVAVAFVLLGRFRNHENYRKYVIVPGSLAIAATAVFWTFQRILG